MSVTFNSYTSFTRYKNKYHRVVAKWIHKINWRSKCLIYSYYNIGSRSFLYYRSISQILTCRFIHTNVLNLFCFETVIHFWVLINICPLFQLSSFGLSNFWWFHNLWIILNFEVSFSYFNNHMWLWYKWLLFWWTRTSFMGTTNSSSFCLRHFL